MRIFLVIVFTLMGLLFARFFDCIRSNRIWEKLKSNDNHIKDESRVFIKNTYLTVSITSLVLAGLIAFNVI